VSAVPPNQERPSSTLCVFREIFLTFLKLGCTSFGGPMAHIGYFNQEFVRRRKWIDETGYIDLLTLCQFLPGPTSSQVGFSLGVLRGNGLLGGFLAWLGFTLPSALIMLLAAFGYAIFTGDLSDRLLHGLKLVAVAVVANAVWVMVRGLRSSKMSYPRMAIAFSVLLIILIFGTSLGQIVALSLGALAGARFCSDSVLSVAGALPFPISKRQGTAALLLFAVAFVGPSLLAIFFNEQALATFASFFHAGSLVFGGGHVVLPMLQTELVLQGWMPNETFLAGYGLAQAIPGPLFSIAAYLGAAMTPEPHELAGATIATVGLFLPGLLLVYGLLPFWDGLRESQGLQAAMRGVTASVVGILAIAFVNSVLLVTVHTWLDGGLAFAGFAALTFWRTPSWAVVLSLTLCSVFLAST